MIFGLIDHDRGNLNPISLEMLTLAGALAEKLDDTLEVVIVGEEARSLADRLLDYGATGATSHVHLIQHDLLDDYAPVAWAQSITQLMEKLSPQAVIAPGTDRGNEVLAHVAAITDLPMAANCLDVQPGEPDFLVLRTRWGGSLLEEANLSGHPKLFSVAPHTIEAKEAQVEGAWDLEVFVPALEDKDFRLKITERIKKTDDRVSLADARVVVGGGRGVGDLEGFAPLETLAGLLDGAVGGSRVATNLGWRPHADQIGQTGTRIAPDLYIVCGISGAIQHMVGCLGANRILAINTDPEAPIMAKADYAVIGDLHEVLPALIEAIKNERNNL